MSEILFRNSWQSVENFVKFSYKLHEILSKVELWDQKCSIVTKISLNFLEILSIFIFSIPFWKSQNFHFTQFSLIWLRIPKIVWQPFRILLCDYLYLLSTHFIHILCKFLQKFVTIFLKFSWEIFLYISFILT